MKLTEIFKIIRRNWFLLVAVTSVTAASIYFFVKDNDDEYTSYTTIYTGIATGYDLNSVSANNNQHKAAVNAFANLISIIDSRDIRKQLGFHLLASHLMLKAHDPNVVKENSYEKLQEAVPASLKSKLVGATVKETAQNLSSYYNVSKKNVIRDILHSDEFDYSGAMSASEDTKSAIEAKRISDSDLLQISFTSTDPALCKNALEILTQLFIDKQKNLHTAQSESVVDYFTTASNNSLQKLKVAEANLLAFQKANGIIDYNSQVENTASEKNTLLGKYNDLETEYAGALATLRSLEQSMKSRGVPNLYSQEVLRLKNRLSNVQTQIAELELLNRGNTSSAQSNRLTALRNEADELSEKMLNSVDKHYANTRSNEGMPMGSVLTDWVRATFLVEELRSKLSLVNKQKGEYAQEYTKLLPLGGENKRLIREVDLAEKEYLAQLDGLKESKLNQQNIELTSQLKVVDPPFQPSSPAIFTRLLLVLFGSFSVFLLTLGALLANALLDQSLRKPSVAARKMQYPVFGILPATDTSNSKHLQLAQRAEDHLARQLILKMGQKTNSGPFVVGVLSSMSGEGKTELCNALASNLISMGIETQVLYPESHKGMISPDAHTNFYAPLQGVLTDASISDLAGFDYLNNAVVLVEFPAVLEDTYPVSLFKHLDLVLLTVKADRVWQQADKTMFESIQKATNAPIETVLSSVNQDDAKEMVIVRPNSFLQEQKVLPSPKSYPALEKA
ncbi:Wzz/FepE/Etk N-terminal domain-containing protein [Rufibacter sp. XAAS-G3-1]|uniref:GumC family protein n=1 Tax=Rufibacter sp. XAAS-G3-1 TaxID=2729134 RepID=UPI0015E68D35|nr:Wzz/FepE/Etk N-terminal domain-containing protein [Rufibacter sp. XAAS-G3-1]